MSTKRKSIWMLATAVAGLALGACGSAGGQPAHKDGVTQSSAVPTTHDVVAIDGDACAPRVRSRC